MAETKLPCDLMISLDFPTPNQALTFLEKVDGAVEWVRVTGQLFFPFGPGVLQQLSGLGYKIFLDLRLSDTPLSIASSILGLSNQPIDRLSIQSTCGLPTLRFAQIAKNQALPDVKMVATTVLYHLQRYESAPEYFLDMGEKLVQRYARVAFDAKIYDVLCTDYEFPLLFKQFGANLAYHVIGCSVRKSKPSYSFYKLAKSGAASIIFDESLLEEKSPKEKILQIREEIKQACLI